MRKAFFDELHITVLMAAPSLGRRSWYHSPSGIKKAAALISQSRRWLYGRVKWAAVRRLFFFCRRPAAYPYFLLFLIPWTITAITTIAATTPIKGSHVSTILWNTASHFTFSGNTIYTSDFFCSVTMLLQDRYVARK